MKLQIDFENKRIKLLDEVELGSFVEALKGLFPGKWKEFKLESAVEYVNWYNPIVIREIQPWITPWTGTTVTDYTITTNPPQQDPYTITYMSKDSISTSIVENGICNVDIQLT